MYTKYPEKNCILVLKSEDDIQWCIENVTGFQEKIYDIKFHNKSFDTSDLSLRIEDGYIRGYDHLQFYKHWFSNYEFVFVRDLNEGEKELMCETNILSML